MKTLKTTNANYLVNLLTHVLPYHLLIDKNCDRHDITLVYLPTDTHVHVRVQIVQVQVHKHRNPPKIRNRQTLLIDRKRMKL